MKYNNIPIQLSPSSIGEDRTDGVRFLSGAEGHASFGPYCPLEPGEYFGGFVVRGVEIPATDNALFVDLVCENGAVSLGSRWFAGDEIHSEIPALYGIDFTVSEPVADAELRLRFAGHGSFEVTRKLIFRRDIT